MDLIEQAAQRLEELRRAGVEVSGPLVEQDLAETQTKPASAPLRRKPDPAVASDPSSVSRRIELDMKALAARGIVTPESGRSRLGDELRVLKRPLLNNATGKGAAPVRDANLIMITSALPGEGKTTVAANLAMSIAMELDHTVLLVDADVARPSQPSIFGYGEQKGLLDLLTNETLEPHQVFLRTNIEKLSILPAGTRHPQATELLASAAMDRLLADMASRYSDRIIIFDSPPLLLTTEARALASHMGQVVLVVRAEKTRHNDVKNALAAIGACPVKMVALNAATSDLDGHGYGYGYGYGYGASGQEKAEVGA